MTHMIGVIDTPARQFTEIDDIRFYAKNLYEDWVVFRGSVYGDTLEVTLDYIDPEGKQVDVDAFVYTHEHVVFQMCFDEELPED